MNKNMHYTTHLRYMHWWCILIFDRIFIENEEIYYTYIFICFLIYIFISPSFENLLLLFFYFIINLYFVQMHLFLHTDTDVK